MTNRLRTVKTILWGIMGVLGGMVMASTQLDLAFGTYLNRIGEAITLDSYLVGIGNFYPEIELEFFSALSSGDYERAHKIVFDIEEPFFEAAVKVGWHLALKEALDALNLMTAWERSPMARLPKALRQIIRSQVVSFNQK